MRSPFSAPQPDINWWPWREAQPIAIILGDTLGPLDLTSAESVQCRLVQVCTGEVLTPEVAITRRVAGEVTIPAQAPGRYLFEYELAWSDGMIQIVPNAKQHLVVHPVT